jgi:hypothetical protein
MAKTEKDIAREVKAMTRKEVLLKALEGRIRWSQAADILGMTARNVRRLRWKMETFGIEALNDGRSGLPRARRIPTETVGEMLRLRRERYPDFSVKHFHEFATEKHNLQISYSWTKLLLQQAGLAQREPGRGKYHRHRERRPMRGMLLHLDASTHAWIEGLPMRDLVVMLDDADGRVLFGRFFEQEGTVSTLWALADVLNHQGRFCELYTDRGSHFCRTPKAGEDPAELQQGQVSRVLKALGIRHILARSPQARGRSERAFGTIQGRLPQELKSLGIRDYQAANAYLDGVFIPDFNRRFTIKPQEPGTAFVSLASVDLELLLSIQHERVVRNDSTVIFEKLLLQLPKSKDRFHYVRCPVLVHEFLNGTLGVSYQGKLLARYSRQGDLLPLRTLSQRSAA